MSSILVFGAGRSARYTIDYLLKNAPHRGWDVTIADASEQILNAALEDWPKARRAVVDVQDDEARRQLVDHHSLVISLLPAQFHQIMAQDCLAAGAHLITPSYITPEMLALDPLAKEQGVLFLNELGLDPGIDHLSAMAIIHRLKAEGAHIHSFYSYTGGLLAPQSDDNPFHYKLSWNPYNVVRSGKDGGLKWKDGQQRYIPYHQLYQHTQTFTLPSGEHLEGYLNRNSLPYRYRYGLEEADTFIRGTLRYPGFCSAWNQLVNAGLLSERVTIDGLEKITWGEFFSIFLPYDWKEASPGDVEALRWLGAESDRAVHEDVPHLSESAPVQVIQSLLEKKWKLQPSDLDRIVMLHLIEYTDAAGERKRLQSTLDMIGEDEHHTAMAKTVGLPLALAAELILEGQISETGVQLPLSPAIYEPLLAELEKHGVIFHEEEMLAEKRI